MNLPAYMLQIALINMNGMNLYLKIIFKIVKILDFYKIKIYFIMNTINKMNLKFQIRNQENYNKKKI